MGRERNTPVVMEVDRMESKVAELWRPFIYPIEGFSILSLAAACTEALPLTGLLLGLSQILVELQPAPLETEPSLT